MDSQLAMVRGLAEIRNPSQSETRPRFFSAIPLGHLEPSSGRTRKRTKVIKSSPRPCSKVISRRNRALGRVFSRSNDAAAFASATPAKIVTFRAAKLGSEHHRKLHLRNPRIGHSKTQHLTSSRTPPQAELPLATGKIPSLVESTALENAPACLSSTPEVNGAETAQGSSFTPKLPLTPSDLVSTSAEVKDHTASVASAGDVCNPVRRSLRTRHTTVRYDESDIDKRSEAPIKRRKLNGLSQNELLTPPTTATTSPDQSHKLELNAVPMIQTAPRQGVLRSPASENDFPPGGNLSSVNGPQLEAKESNVRSEPLPSRHGRNFTSTYTCSGEDTDSETTLTNLFLSKVAHQYYKPGSTPDELSNHLNRGSPAPDNAGSLSNKEFHPVFDGVNHVNGISKVASSNAAQTGSNYGSEAPSPSTKAPRSSQGGRSGKHNGKSHKQQKGKSGGAGGGRDRDTPEPAARAVMTTDESSLLKHIRLRQAELRKFYTSVLTQQREALELMASRDLTKLLKKQKAYMKVPEYEDIVDNIEQRKLDTMALINEEYAMQVALAERSKKDNTQIIESGFKRHCEDTQREHVRGAQGDLIIFHKAHRMAGDDAGTDSGSNIEPYFPRYHELPEPDVGPRGYASARILDEKPFKDHLASYDEQAQREVIDKDIMGPVFEAIAEQNARRREEEERRANFESLLSVADDELREKGTHPGPRPSQASENPQFALSRLADCAEYISRMPQEQAYMFKPAAPRDMNNFPRHHLERIPPLQAPPTMVAQQPAAQAPSQRKSIPGRQKSISTLSRSSAKEDDLRSQSSSSTSTPLATLAPAPARVAPPSISTSHHHHHLLPSRMPPPPSNAYPPPPPPPPAGPYRPSMLAPLVTSLNHGSPPQTPTSAQTAILPGPPPPPPSSHFRHNSLPGHFPPPLFPTMAYPGPPPPPPPPPPAAPAFSPTSQNPPLFGRGPPQSPVERPPSTGASQTRFAHTVSSAGPPRSRVGGSRREKGQITFTPTQTPESERFKSPASAMSSSQLPGQSVLRPGLATNSSNGMGTGKIGNTFVNAAPDANSRAQQAADAAKANASLNQVHGAGPKGGRRLLLPKEGGRKL